MFAYCSFFVYNACLHHSCIVLHIVSVSFSFAVHLLVVEFTLGFKPACSHAVFFLIGFRASFLTLVFPFVYDAPSRVVAVSLFC